jgi:Raf kinase inhibitor-like YbhB/YbcL family protein
MRFRLAACTALTLGALVGAATPQERGAAGSGGEKPSAFALSSTAFRSGGEIPIRYTCEGADVSPPLDWQGVPEGTKSFALVVDDPDAPDPGAPRTTWVHWVVVDLPAASRSLPEGSGADELPVGARHGTNDWRRRDYGGPCPPVGRHRYFHKLYALDTRLPELAAPSKQELERMIAGHVLARAELVGTYEKRLH